MITAIRQHSSVAIVPMMRRSKVCRHSTIICRVLAFSMHRRLLDPAKVWKAIEANECKGCFRMFYNRSELNKHRFICKYLFDFEYDEQAEWDVVESESEKESDET